MRYWLALIVIIGLSITASAGVDIAGKLGGNSGNLSFTGRFPLTGGIGSGSAPPASCGTGVIDASAGCPLPMLGM